MLNEKERLFVEYWELNREREKKFGIQLVTGFPIGLLFAAPIFLLLLSGQFWYKRADMVANAQLSPVLLILAGIVIAAFVAVIYKKHQWEMKDQQYRELRTKNNG